jgi:hypothetical protein
MSWRLSESAARLVFSFLDAFSSASDYTKRAITKIVTDTLGEGTRIGGMFIKVNSRNWLSLTSSEERQFEKTHREEQEEEVG